MIKNGFGSSVSLKLLWKTRKKEVVPIRPPSTTSPTLTPNQFELWPEETRPQHWLAFTSESTLFILVMPNYYEKRQKKTRRELMSLKNRDPHFPAGVLLRSNRDRPATYLGVRMALSLFRARFGKQKSKIALYETQCIISQIRIWKPISGSFSGFGVLWKYVQQRKPQDPHPELLVAAHWSLRCGINGKRMLFPWFLSWWWWCFFTKGSVPAAGRRLGKTARPILEPLSPCSRPPIRAWYS